MEIAQHTYHSVIMRSLSVSNAPSTVIAVVSPTRICADGECVSKSCTTDADCNVSPSAYCEDSFCRPCKTLDNTGCNSALASKCVSSPAYSCAACTSPSDCTHLIPAAPYCNGGGCGSCLEIDNGGCNLVTNSKCVCTGPSCDCEPCSSNSECTHLTDSPYCNNSRCGVCQMSDNIGCGTSSASKCVDTGSAYACTTCSSDTDCNHLSATHYCNSGTCGACKTSDNSGCSSVTTSKCISLLSIAQCTACAIDLDCNHLSSTTYCNNGTCGLCANAGCSAPSAPKCSISSCSTFSCTTCSDDSDCANFLSTSFCEGGSCVTCKTSDNSGCTPPNSVCVSSIPSGNICTSSPTSSSCPNNNSPPIGGTLGVTPTTGGIPLSTSFTGNLNGWLSQNGGTLTYALECSRIYQGNSIIS